MCSTKTPDFAPSPTTLSYLWLFRTCALHSSAFLFDWSFDRGTVDLRKIRVCDSGVLCELSRVRNGYNAVFHRSKPLLQGCAIRGFLPATFHQEKNHRLHRSDLVGGVWHDVCTSSSKMGVHRILAANGSMHHDLQTGIGFLDFDDGHNISFPGGSLDSCVGVLRLSLHSGPSSPESCQFWQQLTTNRRGCQREPDPTYCYDWIFDLLAADAGYHHPPRC